MINNYQYNNEVYYEEGAPWWLYVLIALLFFYFTKKLFDHIKYSILRKRQIELTKDWVMYRIMVPKERHAEEDDQKKTFQEMQSVIEPFFANLNAIFNDSLNKKIFGQDHISLEIISKDKLIYFYLGCPRRISGIIIKNLHAQYPNAEIAPSRDFSFFSEKPLKISLVNISLVRKFIFPIKSYKNLEEDPLNAITNSLSKLDDEESVGIQILIRPTTGLWRTAVERATYNIQHGKSKGSHSNSLFLKGCDSFFGFLSSALSAAQAKSEQNSEIDPHKLTPMQEMQVKLMGEKASKLGFECQIRIISLASTIENAGQNTAQVASAFNQFNSPDSNSFKVKRAKRKREEVEDYIYRIFGRGKKMILNTEELSTVFHLPNRFIETPNISWLLAKKEPPPANIPQEGTTIGNSIYRSETKPIKIKEADRMRHIYMIGKTGVGKTVLFQNMITQDIAEGKGVCYLDPNGDAAEWILAHIPKERAEDVIYFNPGDTDRPFGLNLLEWKTAEQRDFLVQESIQIFYKLFDPNQTGMIGPQFEHWMRNAALTLMSHPEGGTLIDIPRLFTDPDFEKERVSHVSDPVVRTFWEKQMAKTADFHKSEMLNYFTSKFGRFMTNDMMRNIIGQTKSSFDFREVMDGKKILICNLSKGKIGEMNAFLLGMIIVSKIAMGAFSRQDMLEEERTPFFLYVDEFQNFITDVFATILSESRKYKLSLNITNQYIAQLDENIRNAVIGNAGTLISFRVGAPDAEFLIKEFDPLKIEDMTNIDKYNFYIKMLIDGAPTKPFNAQSIWPENYDGDKKLKDAIVELSRLKYGRAKEIVSEEILERSKVDSIDLAGSNQTDLQKIA